MSVFWRAYLLYSHSLFYADMPPALTYLAADLVGNKPSDSLAWAVVITERVALLAVEWYRQLYTQYKMWRINRWLYEQIRQFGDSLERVFGNKRNVLDLYALLDRARILCPIWFGDATKSGGVVSESDQRRSTFVGFDPWSDEYLPGATRELHQRRRPKQYVGCPSGYDWKVVHTDVCYLTTKSGEVLPWEDPANRPKPLLAYPPRGSGAPSSAKAAAGGEGYPAESSTGVVAKPARKSRLSLRSRPAPSCKPTVSSKAHVAPKAPVSGGPAAKSPSKSLLNQESPSVGRASASLADGAAKSVRLTLKLPRTPAVEHKSPSVILVPDSRDDEEPEMAGGQGPSSRGPKRKSAEEHEHAPAAQRQRGEDGGRVEAPRERAAAPALPTPMSLRVSLDSKYEYAVVIRNEGIDIVPVVGGAATGFPFSDPDATGDPKTVVVVRLPNRRNGRRMVMTASTNPSDFEPNYPTGDPNDD